MGRDASRDDVVATDHRPLNARPQSVPGTLGRRRERSATASYGACRSNRRQAFGSGAILGWIWEFPATRGTCWGSRTIIFWGLYRGPPVLGHSHLTFWALVFVVDDHIICRGYLA